MKVNVISESAFTVQGHGVHTAFTETVDALRRYTDAEVVANGRGGADILHLHTVGLYALNKLLFARGRKVVSAHVTPDSFGGSLIGAKYWYGLAKLYLRWFYNRADAVLGVSVVVVDELRAMGVVRPVYLMPNCINTDVFTTSKMQKSAIRRRLGIKNDAFVVISCGQVQPRKRVDMFVRVAEQFPKLTFIWAGGIPFKKLAAELGEMERMMQQAPANVIFTGLLKREEAIDYYRAADLFFLPSMQETFGIVIVEGAAAGLPVLLRDLQQYQVTFGNGYEKGDDDSFGAQVRRFSEDKAYYKQWQKSARSIAERYDSRAGAMRLMELYQNVLSS
jgi:1,2-diacylglycerol-3-alpha-glucose alpha-1,2-galactosyltransferase